MAKYRYRPYRSHRNKIKRRNAVYFLLALIVIIAGITFLGKVQ